MLSVVIVDDEAEIREHIKGIVQWDRLGLFLADEASDSDTALEAYMLFRPQIMIMDIKIPGQNGLEVAEDLLRQDPELKVIMISSFQEFSYAKKALSIGVSSYLSKPLRPEELHASLEQVCNEIHSKRSALQRRFASEQILQQNLDMLRQLQVSSLLRQKTRQKEAQLLRQMELLELNLFGNQLVVLEMAMQEQGENSFNPVFLKHYTETKAREQGYGFYGFYENEVLCCLLSAQGELSDEALERFSILIRDEVGAYFGQCIHIGVGRQVASLKELWLSAEQARMSLEQTCSEQPVVCCFNLDGMEGEELSVLCRKRESMELLLQSLWEGETVRLASAVGQLCALFGSEEEKRELVADLFGQISRESRSHGIYPWNTLDYPRLIKQLFESDDVQFRRILQDFCIRLAELVQQKNKDISSQLIQKAKAYIARNYMNEMLSLEQVSDWVGLSKSYFCSLFHRVEHVTFKAYLNEYRIREAQRLLSETNDKIYEISLAVGVGDPTYFNRIFKRITGMTPLQYRNGNR